MGEDKVSVKILFFAKACEIVGKSQMEMKFPRGPFTGETLMKEIKEICKDLDSVSQSLILALNEEYIDNSDIFYLKEGDHIAIIPPLSGG